MALFSRGGDKTALMPSSQFEFRVGLIPIAMEMPKCQKKVTMTFTVFT